jgi:exodeoxyribonuclease VII large subunit
MREVIYTVSEFNRKVKNYLEDNEELKNFFIEGEMSNVVYYKSGHLYFNIKDEKSQLKCAAFNYKLKRIPEDLKEGDAVKIFADVGFYENRGDFQLLARHIEKKNALGELFAKLEKLKKEMLEKGYFNPEHKKSLPKYPKNIGVVTALTGAAVQDIIKTIKKRDNSINIYIYPAKVQGQGAADEIIAGIKKLDQIKEIDIIIAGRGGGSIEDLWAFNEKEVVMAFFNCKKPIISAVGHEIDFLLSDMVADVRAATPTQAVEICVPEREKTRYEVESKFKYLKTIYNKYIDYLRNEIENRKNNYQIRNFIKITENYNQNLINKEIEINKLLTLNFNNKKNIFNIKMTKLNAMNPLNILSRGYSIVMSNGKVVKSAKNLKINDEIDITTADGKIKGSVKEII